MWRARYPSRKDMKNRRYVLVIMDASGSQVRRTTLARRTLEIAAGSASGVAFILLLIIAHTFWIYSAADETAAMRRENREIKGIISELTGRMPAVRALDTQAELTFSQLWAKSRLGVEPRLVGGASSDDGQAQDANVELAINADRLLSTEPIALPLELDRVESSGKGLEGTLGETLEYFNDAQQLLANTPSVRPAHTPWVTSSFGKRKDPIFNFWVMHKGLDLAGRIGMEIDAPADGVVIATGLRGGYGQTVVIDHGYGIQTHYAHLSRILVRRGDRIHRGQPIAEMGSTGKSTGPHLHYEVRRNGVPMDPRRFILD